MTTLERIEKRLSVVDRFDLEYSRTSSAYSRWYDPGGEYARVDDILSILREELGQERRDIIVVDAPSSELTTS